MRTNFLIRKPGPITTSKPHQHKSERGHLRRLLKERFTPHWRWFAIGTVCALVTGLAGVSYGVLIKLLGDQLQTAAAGSDRLETRQWLLLPTLVVLAATVRGLSLYAMTLSNNTGAQRALVDVSNAQFAALTDGGHKRLSSSASGGFVSRFISDLSLLRDFALRLANNATKGVVTLVGALGMMLWLDWQLALILLIIYPIAFGPVVALGNRVRKRAKLSQEQIGDVTSLLSESFQASRAMAAYGLEGYQKRRAAAGFSERARLYLKVLADKAAIDPILEVAGGVAIAGVLFISAWRISSGASTIGDFLGFIALISVAAPELRALGGLSAVAQEARAATERLHQLLDADLNVVDADDAVALEAIEGDIEFCDVRFGYSADEPVLEGLNFRVKAGETVALVGASGAGKSTVFNLLLRLYDPDAGSVRFDGKNVRDVRKADLRGALALVEQEPALFDDTVALNISLGRLGASAGEIRTAAKAAYADDFIETLGEGYETMVGERGNRLSGGQRQRIALARAIVRNAPVLLLDEATSALDANSEAAVQAALRTFAADRTVMVIAHRLATVRWVDRIIVLDKGRVIETGSHDELLAAGGLYAAFAAEQLR